MNTIDVIVAADNARELVTLALPPTQALDIAACQRALELALLVSLTQKPEN